MSNKNFVLCTCSKCKKKETDNIGDYVHPTTKWRHSKKRKYLNKLINDSIDCYNDRKDELNDNVDCDDDGKNNDDSDNKYYEEAYNRLYSRVD